MKKLTDKERLDWLERGWRGRSKLGFFVWRAFFAWWVVPIDRNNIDAAMRDAKTRKPQDPKGGKP